MDLKEYFFFEKRKDPTFSVKKFAEKLGIKRQTLYRIASGTMRTSLDRALLIEKLTEGKVSGLEVIKTAIIRQKRTIKEKK